MLLLQTIEELQPEGYCQVRQLMLLLKAAWLISSILLDLSQPSTNQMLLQCIAIAHQQREES